MRVYWADIGLCLAVEDAVPESGTGMWLIGLRVCALRDADWLEREECCSLDEIIEQLGRSDEVG